MAKQAKKINKIRQDGKKGQQTTKVGEKGQQNCPSSSKQVKYFARADPMNLAQFLKYKFGAWCSHASELGTSNAPSSAHQHGIISTKPKGLCYAFNII